MTCALACRCSRCTTGRRCATPLRLSVFIEAPREAIDAVMAQHAVVRDLVGNGWMHLFWLEPQALAGRSAGRAVAGGGGRPAA